MIHFDPRMSEGQKREFAWYYGLFYLTILGILLLDAFVI